jgi:predicted MFS family arabinose efflux permease
MGREEKARCILALGVTQTLAWASSYYLPAILAVPIATELDVPPALVFAAVSGALLMSAVIGPYVGSRIDRLGGRPVLIASNLIFALGLVLLSLADGPVGLFAAWALLGIGMGAGLYEAAFATLAGIFGAQARPAITGITLLGGFASTIGWPISTLLNDLIGWRETCLVWAALHLVLGLPLNRFLLPLGTQGRPAAIDEGGGTALVTRPMVLLAFVFAATMFVTSALTAHLPRLLEGAGATPAMALAAGMLFGPAQVVARLLEFGILQRWHPLLSARLATLAHPVGAGALMLLGGPAAAAFALLHGAGNGILTIAKGTLPLALFGPIGYGRRQGWLTAPARGTQALAPFLFALALDGLGTDAVLLTGGLCLASFACLMALDGRHT